MPGEPTLAEDIDALRRIAGNFAGDGLGRIFGDALREIAARLDAISARERRAAADARVAATARHPAIKAALEYARQDADEWAGSSFREAAGRTIAAINQLLAALETTDRPGAGGGEGQ